LVNRHEEEVGAFFQHYRWIFQNRFLCIGNHTMPGGIRFSVWFKLTLSRATFYLAPDGSAKCTKLDPTKLDNYYRPFEVMYLPRER